MAVTIGRKFIEKFVLKKLAERSGKRTGITTIKNVKDPQVQFNIEEVSKTIKSFGIDPNDVKSVAEVEKIMNIRKAVSDQTLKNQFKNLGLDKGVDDLAKKPPFQGFTPKIVPKETEAQVKARMIKENRSNVQKSYLRQLDKKIMEEMDITAKEMENMSSTALDDLRRNADPVGMKKQFDEITEGRGLGDFADDPFKEPDYASGGLARVGMAGGGALFKFIEGLFIKASNDIRLGKGLFKGLDQKQKMVQHDNLTKLVEQFQKTGKFDKKANEYFGIDAEKAFKDAEKQVLSKPTKTLEGIKKEGTIDISNPEVADEFSRFMKESDPEGYKKLEQQIQLDDFDVTGRKKNASGGIAGQLHLNEGGRVPMIFGGSAGLKEMWKTMLKNLNKGRKDKRKTLFPKYSVEEKELLRLGEKYLPKDAANLAAQEAAGKAEGVQILIDRLKHDKKIMEQMAKNKAMNDPGLDFMMKHLEKTMYPPHLKKYTNIDKDILQMETIKKNLIMKDRKLNAEGGRAGFANGSPAVDPRMLQSYEQNKAENEAARELNAAMRSADPNDPGGSLTDIYNKYFYGKGRLGGSAFTGGRTSDTLGTYMSYRSADRDQIIKDMAYQMRQEGQNTAAATALKEKQAISQQQKDEAEGKRIEAAIKSAYGLDVVGPKDKKYALEAEMLGMPTSAYMDYVFTGNPEGIAELGGTGNEYINPYNVYYSKELKRQQAGGIPAAQQIQYGQVMAPPWSHTQQSTAIGLPPGVPGLMGPGGSAPSPTPSPMYIPYADALSSYKQQYQTMNQPFTIGGYGAPNQPTYAEFQRQWGSKGGLANILGV